MQIDNALPESLSCSNTPELSSAYCASASPYLPADCIEVICGQPGPVNASRCLCLSILYSTGIRPIPTSGGLFFPSGLTPKLRDLPSLCAQHLEDLHLVAGRMSQHVVTSYFPFN